eukprot:455062_1
MFGSQQQQTAPQSAITRDTPFAQLPENLKNVFREIDAAVRRQKVVGTQVDVALKQVQEPGSPVEGLEQLLVQLKRFEESINAHKYDANDVLKVSQRKIKVVEEMLHSVPFASRWFLSQVSLPSEYLQAKEQSFESEIDRILRLMDEVELHMRNPQSDSKHALQSAFIQTSRSVAGVASKMSVVHDDMQMLKGEYLSLREKYGLPTYNLFKKPEESKTHSDIQMTPGNSNFADRSVSGVAQAAPVGQQSAFGSTTNSFGFGNTGSAFGAKPNTGSSSFFGSKTATATTTGGGLFGSKPATATTTGGGFFGAATANTAGTAASTGGFSFGSTPATAASTGGFSFGGAAKKPKSVSFGFK